MPNWVTNEINAPRQVLESMINADGKIDFNRVIPFEGEFLNGVFGDAETCAEKVLDLPLDDHPLIRSLQMGNRARVKVQDLGDESFEQFVTLLRNHRKTGHMHSIDFGRSCWGTKWNACDQDIALEDEQLRFDTAWNFPEPVLLKLSELHPDALLEIRYADEDIGSNCGALLIKGGQVIGRDEAGKWDEMAEADREKWKAFAVQVKRWEPESDED